jgi:hypothetical protein
VELGFDFQLGQNIFLFLTAIRPASGLTQIPSYEIDTGNFSVGVKRPKREVDHSPVSSVEDKNTWFYTSTPAHDFMA